jgi:hypothetical protein
MLLVTQGFINLTVSMPGILNGEIIFFKWDTLRFPRKYHCFFRPLHNMKDGSRHEEKGPCSNRTHRTHQAHHRLTYRYHHHKSRTGRQNRDLEKLRCLVTIMNNRRKRRANLERQIPKVTFSMSSDRHQSHEDNVDDDSSSDSTFFKNE